MAKKTSGSNDQDEVVEPTDDVVEEEVEDTATEAEVSTDEIDVVEAPVKKTAKKPAARKNGKKSVRPAKTSDELTPEDGTVSKPEVSKKKLAIILSLIGVVLLGAAAAGYVILGSKDTDTQSNANGNTNSVTADDRVARRIDGVLDTLDHQNRYPVAVMVENLPVSRPQSGLDKANVVYEALAEGGITRFLALYTFTRVIDEIGPVRSARPYYVDLARGYNALYAHAGGSPKGLSRITSVGIPDLNQFSSSQYYYRDRSRKVATEHTLFTSSTLLSRALVDKKLPEDGTYEAWSYKADAPSAERSSSQHITIDFSSFSYKVDYEYNPATNTYARSQAEQPHVMRDGAKIEPKNVVVIRVKRTLESPGDPAGRLTLDVIGSGQAAFYFDGKEYKGTWKKTSAQDGLQLLAEDGSAVKLNAGQTWVEVVPTEQTVTVR